MAPPVDNPKGAVTPGEVFTKGAPMNSADNKRMKRRKMKGSMSGDKDMMKPKM